MALPLIALLIVTVSSFCSPLSAEADGSQNPKGRRVSRTRISRESTKSEVQHPDVGTVLVEGHPLRVKGDSIIVSPELLIFGDDPRIRIKPSDPNYPNPFCPRTSIDFINFVPDTLVIAIRRDDVIANIQLYRGYIDRGRFSIRINLKDSLPAGPYLIDLSVGDKTERVKKMFLK